MTQETSLNFSPEMTDDEYAFVMEGFEHLPQPGWPDDKKLNSGAEDSGAAK